MSSALGFVVHGIDSGCVFFAHFYDVCGDERASAEGVRRGRHQAQADLAAMSVRADVVMRRGSPGGLAAGTSGGASGDDEIFGNVPIDRGVLSLPAGGPFTVRTVAVWQVVGKCGLTLLCGPGANRLLASDVVAHAASLLASVSSPRLWDQPADTLLRPEDVAAVLHHLMPSGTMLLLNARLIKTARKALVAQMAQEKR